MLLQGPQKIAVLLCKFTDTSGTEQNPVAFYKDLFANRGTGGLNDYFAAASLGAINLDGSKVFGWKTIKSKSADYVAANTSRQSKIDGALAAFGEVDKTKFKGVVAIFNTSVGDAGTATDVLAGPGDVNGTFLGHELGHVFGLEHSFDQSTRKNIWWSAPGEYFDNDDIMSAMSCAGDIGHRFSPRGPQLNVAHLDRMGWMPPERIWQPNGENSSSDDTIDIVALEHPETPGYLAALLGDVYVEFRLSDGWDSAIGSPCVLLHKRRDPNTLVLASDAASFNNHWQPGQAYGSSPNQLAVLGGSRIEIISYNLQGRTARIHLQKVAKRVIADGPGVGIGGIEQDGGGILILPNGGIVHIPPRSPVLILSENSNILYSGLQQPGTLLNVPGSR